MAIYFTSDLHLCHDREFIYKPRGFASVIEMNQSIVDNWNKTVDYNDDIYILGDLMLNDNDEGIKLIKQLKGNIHIIRGNHDTDSRLELYNKCYNVVSIEGAEFLNYNGYRFYLSHFPTLCANFDEDKPLKKKNISLCGHTHTSNKFSDMNKGLIYHVDCDAHNCTPVSIEEIINDIRGLYKN